MDDRNNLVRDEIGVVLVLRCVRPYPVSTIVQCSKCYQHAQDDHSTPLTRPPLAVDSYMASHQRTNCDAGKICDQRVSLTEFL